jgi:hypothetical protein
LAALTRMELNALLPQPFCQIHGAWFKVGRAAPAALLAAGLLGCWACGLPWARTAVGTMRMPCLLPHTGPACGQAGDQLPLRRSGAPAGQQRGQGAGDAADEHPRRHGHRACDARDSGAPAAVWVVRARVERTQLMGVLCDGCRCPRLQKSSASTSSACS